MMRVLEMLFYYTSRVKRMKKSERSLVLSNPLRVLILEKTKT
ncbi:hypothetical protein F441_11828 [Phytophthora nicotianae CJ01A1]|uniref:Uncharacterized protein n=1 Tax=Phytophthora nicotianae CJ01A1 TaxID=1317063 RepID=W2WRP8_PHYNI|nr:hypothetical protein F441_11828 [Phytophthora nicotianae CJ01A1]